MSLGLTPSQTVGPFFAHALPWPDGPFVVAEGTPGAFWLRGVVLDGTGEPVPDALVETWQADQNGRYAHPEDPRGDAASFRGFARCPTDSAGRWGILTVAPGPVPHPGGGMQAPHLAVSVFARGLLDRVVTRVYLPGTDPATDPVLSTVDFERRGTLVAVPDAGGLRFDIRLQGPGETVFLDV